MSLFNKTFSFVFMAFIALTLCFGRAFSIIHIGQVFITEIVLFLGVIFLLLNFKEILKLPRGFLIPFSVYFIIGCLYFAKGLLEFNLYTLRDIVFFGYALFLPIAFIIFSKRKLLKTFLWVLVLSNIFAVTLTRILIYRNIWLPFKDLIFNKIRAFNYLLYFGISISFLVPLFNFVRKKIFKILIILLCILNLYLIMIWGERAAWVAVFILFIFLVLTLNKKIIKFFLYSSAIFIIISTIFIYFLDSMAFRKDIVSHKLTSLRIFLSQITLPKDKRISSSELNEMEAPEKSKKENSFIDRLTSRSEKMVSPVENKVRRKTEFLSNIEFRMYMWDLAIQAGFRAPVLGIGYGALLESPKPWQKSTVGIDSGITSPHNHILSIFYKMGLLGTGLFLFMNIYVLLLGISFIKDSKDAFLKFFATGSLGGFVFWHAMAAFFNVIDSPPTSIFLWVIAGFIFACSRMDKEGASGEKDGK